MNFIPDPKEFNQSLLKFVNQLRTDPSSLIPQITYQKSCLKGMILFVPDNPAIKTKEGTVAFDEAIAFLKTAEPVDPLQLNDAICQAAQLHTDDLGAKCLCQHQSSDGKNLPEWIELFTEWEGTILENIDFGNLDLLGVVLSLVVDDGCLSRCHRKNLFDPTVTCLGVGIASHPIFEFVCVIDFATTLRQKGMPFYKVPGFKYDFDAANEKKLAEEMESAVDTRVKKIEREFEGKKRMSVVKYLTNAKGEVHVIEIEEVV